MTSDLNSGGGNMEYPAGMTGAELDDASLEEVIENADRKELTRMIFEYMKPEHSKALLREMIDQLTLAQTESLIEELLYDWKCLSVAKEYITDNCPEIAE